jgi:hypothetical protein
MKLLFLWFAAVAFADPYSDGVQALKDGRYQQAKSLLTQAAALDESNSDALWELGWAYWTLEDYAGAARAWERVQALDPDRAELSTWLGNARARAPLAGAKPDNVEIPMVASEGRVTFAAAGDTMMGSDLRWGAAGLAPGNGEILFADVAPIFSAADIAFVNIEGPLADGIPSSKCGPNSTSCYAFRTPTKYAKALVSANIDVASLANNHALDLGTAGQQSTMDALDKVGVAHAGRYGDTATIERNGIKVGFIAAHSGSCCLNVNAIEEVMGAVALMDRDHDIVVLSFHGGAEGAGARHVPGKTEIAWGERRGDVKKLARAAVDAGADLVLGHGPHVLRAIEVYKGRLIAYSLGNFTGYRQFGAGGGYTGTSVIVEAVLADNGVLVSAKLHPLALDKSSIPRLDPAGLAFAHIGELSAADFPTSGVKVGDNGVLTW